MKRWKPLLDEVLDTDNEKIRKDQIDLAVAALANSARVTALPVILHLVETARYDLNRPLPSADRHVAARHVAARHVAARVGPQTQQIGDFFRSNYAGLLALLTHGARMPARTKKNGQSLLAQIAADG